MRKGIKVTYLHHSSFLVETENSYLLFDYWQGSLPKLQPQKKLYIFVSHAHHDHYSKEIFRLENQCIETYYILSDDVRKSSSYWKAVSNITFLKPGDQCAVEDCSVTAFESTDEGDAFLVETEGWTLFHAGDLHWWEWPGDPEDLNAMMGERYRTEIDKLKGIKIDAAFVVLDPRQEESGRLGMEYFVKTIDVDYVFPMHWWDDYKYVDTFYREKAYLFEKIRFMQIHEQGETFELDP